jgi:acyl-coenzyme A synthetase/AMP-(fatty) acid ligase
LLWNIPKIIIELYFKCKFHIAGIYSVFTLLSVGGSVSFLNTLPSSLQDITFALAYNKCTVLNSPPIIVDNLIEYVKRTNDLSCISKLRYMQYGGAALSSESGEWIHKHGIVGTSIYGSSEAGVLLGSDLDGTNKSGNSLVSTVMDENGESYCIFEIVDKSEPDIRHLYVRPGCPTFANDISNRPDGGYDTNDLFKEDTENPGSFIYYGRKDDTLVLYNGEKNKPSLDGN